MRSLIHPGGRTKSLSQILRGEAGPCKIKYYINAGLPADGASLYSMYGGSAATAAVLLLVCDGGGGNFRVPSLPFPRCLFSILISNISLYAFLLRFKDKQTYRRTEELLLPVLRLLVSTWF